MSRFRSQSRLARKFGIFAFAVSLLCAAAGSGILLVAEFNQGKTKIDSEILELGRTNAPSIALGLWVLNMDLVASQLDGLANLPFISRSKIIYEEGEIVSRDPSEKPGCRPIMFNLTFNDRGQDFLLGTLELCPDYRPLKKRLSETGVFIFFIQLGFALTIALTVFLLFFKLVGRHIESIASQAKTLSPENLEQPISLARKQRPDDKRDELDVLENALNSMRINLRASIRESRKADERHRTLFETMHQGVAYLDERGGFISANPAALKILGVTMGDLPGKTLMELNQGYVTEDMSPFPHSEHPAVIALDQARPVTGAIMGRLESRVPQWLSVTAIPLFRDKSPSPYQVHIILEDVTRRRTAEEILRRYEQIISSTNDLMSFVDEHYVYQAVNKAYLTAHEKELSDIVGHSVEELAGTHVFFSLVKPKFDKALGGETVQYQSWFEYKGYGRRYMKVIYHPFVDGKDKVRGVVVCVHDLTETKEAETALIKSELKYKVLFDNMAQGVFYQQADGRIVDFNANALKMFGLSADQLMGRTSFDPEWKVVKENGAGFPPEDHPSMEALRTGKAVRDRILGIYNPREASWRWLNVNAIPQFRSRETTPFQVFVTMHDITLLRRAEAELQVSHERFLTVLNSIDAFIYVSNIDTHEILFMNQFMKDYFKSDFTGRVCYQAFKGIEGPCAECRENPLLDKEGQPLDVKVWTRQDSADNRWYINHNRAIQWTSGTYVRLHIATDITELKQMEDELRQAQKMESIGTLAGGVAHDFNNILSIILGNAELAFDEVESWHPVYTNIEEIKRASLRAKGVIRQLLNFSRKTEFQQVSLDLDHVLRESLTLLRSSIPSNIDLIPDIRKGRYQVMADPSQIHQVVMNLCTNAYQAMVETGGRIEVGLKPAEKGSHHWPRELSPGSGDFVEIWVRDNGPGISDKLKERIFDPYFTTKDVGQGTGLGLAVVQGIVQNHNGAVRVESPPDSGACFRIFLPAGGEPDQIQDLAEKEPDSLLGSGRILVVDDEKEVADISRQFLSRQGYVVDVETNPLKAARLMNQSPGKYDLVITDMTMPEMNGLEFSAIVRQVNSEVPIIICTGHSPLMDDIKARELKISAYAMKPVTMSEISTLVKKAMGNR